MMSLKIFKILVCSFFLLACKNPYAQNQESEQKALPALATHKNDVGYHYYHPDARTKHLVDSFYQSMSDEERAAQMIMTASSTAENMGYPYAKAKSLMEKGVVGNLVFLKGDAQVFTQQVSEWNKKPGLKPLFACDCEPSLLNNKWSHTGGIKVSNASEQSNRASVVENTEKINQIMQAVGVTYNFAPIADRAANTSVINKRSFGNQPERIVALAQQFIQTSQSAGIAATIKHFPGHGLVKGDTHKQSVSINGELKELPVFKALIQSEEPPVSVMVGHINVVNNKNYDTKGLPATLSPVIVTDLLRKELGFEGIITTDALNMAAATVAKDADWQSVLAGVDLVLMPAHPVRLHQQIVAALKQNDDFSRKLEASIKRIIKLKVVQQYILK